ncbi:hypothetical protein EKK58_08010 [Candidatus Dependentiae bacterium]|nr:MAG: hypothetical protein EKK58_08010 [Candidatus Dependentiae bacterium]
MTDKPKIVPLKAIPKEAPPEEKKYKVRQQLIDEIKDALAILENGTTYEVSETALEASVIAMKGIVDGFAHDAVVFMHHKDSRDLAGAPIFYGTCQQTAENPYKFLTLFRRAAMELESNYVYPQEEFYE